MLLRLGFSLSFVLGMIWCAAWVVRRRNGQGGGGAIKMGRRDTKGRTAGIEILERRSLGRHSGVALVRVGSRRLLVGITEQHVQLLSDLNDLDPAGDVEVTDTAGAETISHIDLTDIDLVGDTPSTETIHTVARRTGPHGTESRSPRTTLVDAVRELTVRRT
jgi:flagellar protein FliO/FliZ